MTVDREGAEFLRLEPAGRVDVAPLLPVEVSSLPRGLHARCIAFHPSKPMLAVGVQTCVGGYDLVSGVRQGRADIRAPPVALMFSRDGSLLVVATAEWHIVGINTTNWRMRVLAPFNELRSQALDNILLAITGGNRPLIFFTRTGKNSIRMAVNPAAGAEKKSADKKLKWGVKLKLDVNKAVVGLAAHPTTSQLLVLYDDGALRGYVLTSSGLNPIWNASYTLPGDASIIGRLSMDQNPLQTLPHPFIEGAALLAVGLGSPLLLLLELVAKQEPRVVLKAPMPGSMPLIGLGLQQVQHVLFAFTTTSSNSQLKVLAWQMINASGLFLESVPIEVPDLDEEGSRAPAAGADQGSRSSSKAIGTGGWQGLWGGDNSQTVLQNAAAGSFLLDKLLAPVVQSAVLHPTLGCVAVQRAPPAALRQAPNIMQQRLGLISAPEAIISRRTASVPLLRLLRPSLAGAAWPGGRVAAMHTDINFWQPAAGLGTARLQFPCHLYFLSPGRLSKYSLASKHTGCFVSLPPVDTAGTPHEAKQLVHSPRQHAWLVFFESRLAATEGSPGAADESMHFTLVQDAAGAGQATWFLPGKTGVFLGPQDLYFAILGTGSSSSTVSVYRTPGFRGNSHSLYTIQLAKPSSFGCGLFPGPAALAAPRVGAEAAAQAAKEAAEAADKAAQAAAEAAEKDIADAPAAADGSETAAAAAAAGTATGTSVAQKPQERRPRIRRPGETWRPSEDDQDSEEGGGMMIPVLGIGPSYQGPVGKGLGFKQQRAQRGFGAHGLGFDEQEEEEQHEPGERHTGGGVVLWHAAGDKLVMAGLPAPGVQYAAGDDSDDPDAADAATAAAPDKGLVVAEHSLQLQPLERVVTVVWQNTTQAAPLEPYQCAAAVLTTQRLLLVTGDLSVLAAIDASCGSVGLANGITSLLWVGPALLFMTAAGQVMQLTWTGQTQHMASVASQPPPLLAGALADSLLLLRPNVATGEPEVTSRSVGILQPLVLGWTSLASSGLLPKGLNTARAALQALLEAFDATHVTSGMLWSLIQGWCGDVAAALASHATDVEPSVQLAANAAAGKWAAVVSTLRAEHERSVFYPAPAPPGSQLHHKLLAAAAGSIMHGQFSEAQSCLEAAGEWETMMAVCVCSGDFAALRSLAAGLQSGAATAAGGGQEATDIARLARALVAAYEKGGRAFALNRMVGDSNNWRLRPMMADDSFFSRAADWTFGGPGKLPAMETSSFNAPAGFIQEGDVGPLPRADAATLGAYLGNADLASMGDAAAEAEAAAFGRAGAAAGMASTSSVDADFLANLDNLVALSSRAGESAGKGDLRRNSSAASSIDSDFAGGEGQSAAAGAAGGSRTASAQRDPFSYSDDGDDDGTSFGYKFRIHIKDTDNPAAAGATGASTADLRAAASKLKLGPPGTTGTFKEQLGKPGKPQEGSSSGRQEASSSSGGLDALYDLSFLSKPAGGTAAAQLPSTAGAAAAAGSALPPRAPSMKGAAPKEDSFSVIGELTGISSASGGLGGPPMRPKSQTQQQMPLFTDDDFFAALAPALATTDKGKAAGYGASSSSSMQARPGSGSAAAGNSGVEDFFADFSGSTTGIAGIKPAVSLKPPSAITSASTASGAGPSSSAAAAAAAVGRGGKPQPAAAGPPPKPAARAVPPPPAAAAAGPTGGDATALYLQGVSAMEAANWDGAATAFAAALTSLQSEAPSDSRAQRQAFAAQYLAAVMLLKAAGSATGAKAARLYRYAAALKLDDRHTVALVKESVIRNKHVGNYKYAADQLTWLVTRSLGSAPMEVMAKLQEDIDECDQKGGRNAAVDADENVSDWVSLVAAGASRQDVEEVVLPLVQQA